MFGRPTACTPAILIVSSKNGPTSHAWGKAHTWGKAHARGRSWVGLIRACGAAATCVWSAYGLCPSHFDCLRREWSDLTRMEHARGKAHAWGKAHAHGCRWSNGLTTGGESIGWRMQAGEELLQWTIRCLDNMNSG